MKLRIATWTTPKRTTRAVVVASACAAIAAWAYWAISGVYADPPSVGPIRSVKDIPPGIQEILKQAPGPTHDKPTPWGLLTINPVVNGEALLNPQTSPVPDIHGPGTRGDDASGAGALERIKAAGLPSFDIPDQKRKGMSPSLVSSLANGDLIFKTAFFGQGDGTEEYQSLHVTAYTPVGVVAIEEFPDNAIRDFSANYAVNGNPTITVFPDKGTADPRDERFVAWSQGRLVFIVQTTGLFTDDEVLNLARHLSNTEEVR